MKKVYKMETFQFSRRFGVEAHFKDGRERRVKGNAEGIETSSAIIGRNI